MIGHARLALLALIATAFTAAVSGCQKAGDSSGSPTGTEQNSASSPAQTSTIRTAQDNPLYGTWIALDEKADDINNFVRIYPAVYQFSADEARQIDVDCCTVRTQNVSYKVRGNDVEMSYPGEDSIFDIQIIGNGLAFSNSDHFTLGGHLFLRKCSTSDMEACHKEAESAWSHASQIEEAGDHKIPPPTPPATPF
jgi:hypothetical protein